VEEPEQQPETDTSPIVDEENEGKFSFRRLPPPPGFTRVPPGFEPLGITRVRTPVSIISLIPLEMPVLNPPTTSTPEIQHVSSPDAPLQGGSATFTGYSGSKGGSATFGSLAHPLGGSATSRKRIDMANETTESRERKFERMRECPVCGDRVGHLKRHVRREHLPWFMSLDLACWECEQVETTPCAINARHVFSMGHSHGAAFTNENAARWVLLAKGARISLALPPSYWDSRTITVRY